MPAVTDLAGAGLAGAGSASARGLAPVDGALGHTPPPFIMRSDKATVSCSGTTILADNLHLKKSRATKAPPVFFRAEIRKRDVGLLRPTVVGRS